MPSLLALAVAATLPGAGGPSGLELRSEGVFDAIPFSMVMNVEHMSLDRPEWVTHEPAYENTPWYCWITLGDGDHRIAFALDESDDRAALYIDANANGDLTDDQMVAGERQVTPEESRTPQLKIWIYDLFAARLVVPYADGHEQTLAITFRTYGKVCRDLYDHMAPDIVYWSTYYRVGRVAFAESEFEVAVKDQNADGRFDTMKDDTHLRGDQVYIDTDRNGTFDPRTEGFALDAAFEVGGAVYEVGSITARGDQITVVPSDREVVPTTLRVGQMAPDFEIPGVGRLSSLRGNVVLIDFWATWCVPCLAEMPNVIRVHERFGAEGFHVVGVSIDREEDADKMHEVAREHDMTWPEVHDPMGAISRQYFVSAIPATFLIDAEGRIIASHLRGRALDDAVEAALAVEPAADAK